MKEGRRRERYRKEKADFDGNKEDSKKSSEAGEEVELVDLPDIVSFMEINEAWKCRENDGSENGVGSEI